MPRLFGQTLKKRDLQSRGDTAQFGGIERALLDDGPGRGIRTASLRTGTGLEAQVLLDRCLDIGRATFNGVPLGLRTFTGEVHPAFYDPAGLEWLRTFNAGLLTTCGLSNVGSPSRADDQEYGLHGRIANTPASDVAIQQEWRGDDFRFSASGTMREGHLFGPKLVLRRTVSSKLGANWIEIRDTITNEDFAPAPLMLLYHFNIGFPIVNAGSRLLLKARNTLPRDAEAQKGAASCRDFEPPQQGFMEQVFYHDMSADKEGRVRLALVTPTNNLGVALEYNRKELPRLIQWKMMRQGAYVCGLEPANCHVGGRAAEREAGTLQMLKPGEEKSVTLRLSVLASSEEVTAFEKGVGLKR